MLKPEVQQVTAKNDPFQVAEHPGWVFRGQRSEMDYDVEATIHLYAFRDENQVRRILASHGFRAETLSGRCVRVFGSFQQLQVVRDLLAPLVDPQSRRAASSEEPRAPPAGAAAPPAGAAAPPAGAAAPRHYREPLPQYGSALSGAAPRHHREPLPQYGSAPSGATVPRHYREPLLQYGSAPSSSSKPPRHHQLRAPPSSSSILVDANVFLYAKRLRRRDISDIETSSGVDEETKQVGDAVSVTLRGRGAQPAAAKLQRLFEELDASLRTQEVSLRDVVPAARPLLDRDTHGSVLLRQTAERLCLIGPSTESYELKQRLLGKPVESSGRRGRSLDRSSGRRSSSLQPPSRRKAEPQRDPQPPAAAAATRSYSPSRYRDDGAAARHNPSTSGRARRSLSETRSRDAADTRTAAVQQNKPKQTVQSGLLMKPLLLITGNKQIQQMKKAWRP